MTKLSATIHKWLALLMAVQILFWFVSGLFFAAVPIERVRSEHRKAAAAVAPVPLDVAAAGIARIAEAEAAPADKIELRALLGRPVALATRGEQRPVLYDLANGRTLSPLPEALAREIAERDLSGDGKAIGARWITRESPEYRGALPAWRVDFEDMASRSLYVAADSGVVTARRSTLWRVYDFLWSLHIMDFKGHQDFNNPLLVIATALGLVIMVTGIIMFPARLGYTAWRRRRRRARAQ